MITLADIRMIARLLKDKPDTYQLPLQVSYNEACNDEIEVQVNALKLSDPADTAYYPGLSLVISLIDATVPYNPLDDDD